MVEIKEWNGLNNVGDPLAFGAAWLTRAKNVDVDDAGRAMRTRPGRAKKLTGGYASLQGFGPFGLAVKDGDTLVRLEPSSGGGLAETTLRAGLSAATMAYHLLNGAVYYSNQAETGVIRNGEDRRWGITPPSSQPVLAALGYGSLAAGTYQAAVTFARADGIESGTGPSAEIAIGKNDGIKMTSIPVSSEPDVVKKRVYLSGTDGEVLYRAGEIDNADTTFTYERRVPPDAGMALVTQFKDPPPAGSIIRDLNGKMYVAQENVLWQSEPYHNELFDLRYPYTFDGVLTMVEPVSGGIYVSTTKEIVFMSATEGDEYQRRVAADYPAIEGMSGRVPGKALGVEGMTDEAVVFMTTRGLCAGGPGGVFLNLTEGHYAFPVPRHGELLFRRREGMTHAVLIFKDATPAENAYTGFGVDEVRDNY